MKNYLILLVLLGPFSLINGQVTRLNSFFSDDPVAPVSVVATSDGNTVLLGKVEGNLTDTDILLTLISGNGNIIWNKEIGGSRIETPRGLIALNTGGFLLVGNTTSGNFGNSDICLVKVDPSGNTIWAKTYGGAGEDRGFSILELPDGNIMVAGTTTSFGNGARDAYLLRVDPDGNLLWSKHYGGVENDNFFSIQPDGNDAFILAGPTFSFGRGQHDIWVMKVDGQGNVLWNNLFGTSADEHSRTIRPTPDNGWVVVGHTSPGSTSQFDGLILKLDNSGNLQWARSFGGNAEELLGNLILTQDNNRMLITGHTRSAGGGDKDLFLLDLDLQGNLNEAFVLGGTEDDELLVGAQQTLLEFPGNMLLLLGELQQNGKDEILVATLGGDPSENCLIENWDPNPADLNLDQQAFIPPSGNSGTQVANISFSNQDYELTSRSLCPVPPVADFMIPDTICAGQCIDVLDTSTGNPEFWYWTFEGAEISMSMEAEPQNICFVDPGAFSVSLVVENSQGADTLSRILFVLPAPEVDLGADITLCPNDSLIVRPDLPDDFLFRWNDGFAQLERVIRSEGTYQLEVFNDFCSAGDEVIVETLFCETCSWYIPNAFSPNEDGINDQFQLYFSCPPIAYRLQLFDRWGNLVYSSEDPQRGWDGLYLGRPAAEGVYVYQLEFRWQEGDTMYEEQLSGDVTLLR